MDPKKDVETMFRRLTQITNELAQIDETYPTKQVWRRALRSLPTEWDAKRTTIIESNKGDSISYDLDQLHGTRKTHELEVSTRKEAKKKEEKTRANGIALSSQLQESDDEDMALFTRKFK